MAAASEAGALPASSGFVDVQLLDGGSFIGDISKVHAGVARSEYRMYDWCFYIAHGDRHVLWDVGLDPDFAAYTPWVRRNMLAGIRHAGPRRPLGDQLRARGVAETDIDTVIFSHAHWDHCRPIRSFFPKAVGLFGPGTQAACAPGHLVDPDVQWDGQFFDPERAQERWKEFCGPWRPFGPFEYALDFFGDGSFWVIQAPGHMPGNLCAAARLRNGEWVLLGGDCCHSRELLDGVHEIAHFHSPGIGTMALHADVPVARDTISCIRTLEKEYGFHIALAHDASWMKDGRDLVLMSLLDGHMARAARERIPLDLVP